MSMETIYRQRLEADVGEPGKTSIHMVDLYRTAHKLDGNEDDPVGEEIVDDLDDSTVRYLGAVIRHTTAKETARRTHDGHDIHSEEVTDRQRNITHTSVMSKLQSTIRMLRPHNKRIARWYDDRIFHTDDIILRKRIGKWALQEALRRLKEDND